MKNGEIACVVGRVISVEPLALALYDLRGLFKNAILLFNARVQRSMIESIPLTVEISVSAH